MVGFLGPQETRHRLTEKDLGLWSCFPGPLTARYADPASQALPLRETVGRGGLSPQKVPGPSQAPAATPQSRHQTLAPGSGLQRFQESERRASGAEGPSDARVGWASPQGHQTDQIHP